MISINFDKAFEYGTKNNDESEDKWKIYLFENLTGNLRERLKEMIETSENKSFYLGLKHEYGYNEQKDLYLALSYYKKGARANSTDFLSMARLYDIYKTKDKKFDIKNDKNLEFIYLFKSFAYMPISYLNTDIKKNRFPLNIKYAVGSFLKSNDPNLKNFTKYLESLSNSGKYNDILSRTDYNLIKGFLEGYINYYADEDEKSLDLLIALSFEGNLEANCRLISIYLNSLYKEEISEKKIEMLKTKIYDQFEILVKNKYYKVYGQYGLFLYNEMRMFDVALNIFKEGYEHNIYECAIYYFHAFTKSDNQSIYNIEKFNPNNFINIFQTLIDAFIYGKYFALELLFDFYYTIGKRYNLFSQLYNKYIKYLDEIALICLSFIDKKNGKENIKKYNPYEIEKINHSANHALSMIYIYGLSDRVKKNLLKAEICLKAAMELNEYSQPYYTFLIYKVRKKLFKLKAFEDENDLIECGNELFKLYEKYKDYKSYGNSFYYIFGKLYEKGIGTNKDDRMAYKYYQRGCNSLVNLNDSFIIVYKRYLSMKILLSNKFLYLYSFANNTQMYFVNFRLSIGKDIILQVNEVMTFGYIKTELYKRIELQNLKINTFLFGGDRLKEQTKLCEAKIKNNDVVVVVVEQKKHEMF